MKIQIILNKYKISMKDTFRKIKRVQKNQEKIGLCYAILILLLIDYF
jgi:hypothetical protein